VRAHTYFCFLLATVVVGVAATAGTALADDPDIAPEDVRAKALAEPGEKEGFEGSLKLGATASLQHSDSVVGQVDGVTFQFGLVLDGAANLYAKQHAWENTLKIQHTQTKTPQIERFVMTLDNLEIMSLYTYRLSNPKWLGPYARLRFQTAIFEGFDVKADDTTVVRTPVEGTATTETVPAQDVISLTGYFEPIRLIESVGLFANPVEKPEITVKSKLGVGAEHIIVGTGYTIADDADTPELELKQLDDSTQIGGELEVEANGKVKDKLLSWNAKVRLFYPFYSSSDEYSGVDAMTTEFEAGFSLRLAEWASLDYVLSVKRIPLILDEWQIQNGLLFTAGFTLI